MSNIFVANSQGLYDQYSEIGSVQKKYAKIPDFGVQKQMLAKKVLGRVKELDVLKDFYQAFSGWCCGLGVSEENGMCLLSDNTSGCQTMMVRYRTGVALLHTEEDFDDVIVRMREPRIYQIKDKERELIALSYIDLMPGAGVWGWQRGLAVAVDSLFVNEKLTMQTETPMLSNIVAWQIWFGKPEHFDEKYLINLVKDLKVLVDGYLINMVYRKQDGYIGGISLAMAGDQVELKQLDTEVGSYLGGVNILPSWVREGLLKKLQSPVKDIEDYKSFEDRLKKMGELRDIYRELLNTPLPSDKHQLVHNQIYEAIFDKYREDFVNEWMGGAAVCLMDEVSGESISCRMREDISNQEMEVWRMVY